MTTITAHRTSRSHRPVVLTVQRGSASLYSSTLTSQVPHQAARWLLSQASAYEPGGSAYTQQIPRYTTLPADAPTVDSTYREQVPDFRW